MYKLPQQLAVAQFFTSLPPTPLHPLPLFCVGFGYYTLFYLTAYFFNFHLSYIHVFLCWNLICPVGVCVSIIIETMKVGDAPSTWVVPTMYFKKSNSMMLTKKTRNFLCKMKWIRVSKWTIGFKTGSGFEGLSSTPLPKLPLSAPPPPVRKSHY